MTQEIITSAPVDGDAAKPPAAARPAWRCWRPTIAVVLTFGFGLLVLVAVSSVMWVALGTAQKNTLALVRQVADFSVAGLIDQIGYHLGSAQQQSERSEEHTSELQSLMRISYAVFCLKKKN